VNDESKPITPMVVRTDNVEESVRSALERIRVNKRRRSARFVLAALGSIPWVGGFLSAAANLDAERDQGKVNDLQAQWLEEHRRKIEDLADAIGEVADRIDTLGPDAQARAETPDYLNLVRKGFGV